MSSCYVVMKGDFIRFIPPKIPRMIDDWVSACPLPDRYQALMMNEYDVEIVQGKLDVALFHLYQARRRHVRDQHLPPAVQVLEEVKELLEGRCPDGGA